MQLPLTAVLLLFELTHDYFIIIPTLASVGISYWVASFPLASVLEPLSPCHACCPLRPAQPASPPYRCSPDPTWRCPETIVKYSARRACKALSDKEHRDTSRPLPKLASCVGVPSCG